MDAESIQKTLNIFNFTATYVIVMKLTRGKSSENAKEIFTENYTKRKVWKNLRQRLAYKKFAPGNIWNAFKL